MQVHKKIIHHIHKQKENLIAHVNRHHKKYIFGAGLALGLTIIKIIAIVGVFLGINMILGKTSAIQEKLKIYQALETVIRIDDIAHEESNEDPKESPFTQEDKKLFDKIDTRYHAAKNINQKYVAARDMVDLLSRLELTRPVVTEEDESDLEKDNIYRELLLLFYTIK